MNMTKELSESLLAACKAAGIESPRYIAQNANGKVIHHNENPTRQGWTHIWGNGGSPKRLNHPPYADNWQESLLEWVGKPSAAWDDFVTGVEQHTGAIASCTADSKPQGEPLADVLARHPDHVADTSKNIDDACEIGYHSHLEKGNVYRWSRLDCYRAAWQDALTWKRGGDD
jgi:hypothetical protein